MPQTIVVKRYKTEKEYQRDAQKMARKNYKIINVVSETQRTGIFRFIMFGFLFPPKPHFVVTYSL